MSTNDMFTLLYDGSEKVVITKWRVTSEFMINQSPFVLFLYRSIDSSGLQRENELKYKVNKSGITVRRLYKKVGDTIEPGDVLLEYEPCSHSTLMKDLCALCGINIDKFDTSEKRKIAENTSVAMVHSIPELRVSKQVAEDLGRADEDRLLKAKKLVLLVDLDQTIIHSTNQDVPNDIEGIHHYQLCGPNSPWYHTKFRPFMTEFLEEISNYFELHICTFGVRRYAHQISNLIDPKCRFFPKDRILSRDEFFDPRSKTGNMKSLFPCGDSMVCIIDDRVDVWNYSPNVVHVKPYLCFKTEDINAPEKLLGFKSFEENVDQSATSPSSKPTANADTTDTSIDNKTESNDSTENKDSKSELKNEESSTEDDKKVDKEDIVKESTIKKEDILIDDTDDYLLYLKDILIRIHTEYYREYDEKKRYQCEGEEILIPDLKRIIPQVRKLVLHGVNIVFSGVIATNSTPDSNKYYRLAKSLGAMITNDVIVYGSPRTTHLIGSKWGTVKVNKCLKHPHIKMVTPEWLFTCAERWEKVDEALFQLKKDTVYNKLDREDGKAFFPYYQPSSLHKSMNQPSTSKANPQAEDEEEVAEKDDSKTMIDFSPLSSFSLTDLSEMGKEVDDACDDTIDLDDDDDDEDDGDGDEEDDKEKDENDDEDEDESMDYENEGEFPQGWQMKIGKRSRGLKRSLEDEDDGADDNESSGSSQSSTTSSSVDDDGDDCSLDEEAAALERQFSLDD